MSHPVIPLVLDLAQPVAQALDLEIVDAIYRTNQAPPVLRIDVRSRQDATNLENCEQMSRALELVLDEASIIPDAYVLEISSPGLSDVLTQDRDFTAFRSFPVTVHTTEPFRGKKIWSGTLTSRDPDYVYLNLKGRSVAIPRTLISQVQLQDPP